MKRRLSTAIALITIALTSTVAQAQGRHDEKPHGMKKPAATAAADPSASKGSGGRHDEGPTTHGKKAPAKKKDASADSTPQAK